MEDDLNFKWNGTMLWMFVRPMRHLVTHGGAELLRLLVAMVLMILTNYLMVIG